MSSDEHQERSLSNLDNSTLRKEPVVLVPVSNPDTEAHLITLGAAIARHRNGRLVAVTIVRVPDQVPLETARDTAEYRDSKDILNAAEKTAADMEVPIETRTIFSHNLFKTVFNTAREHEADLCVLGWGDELPGVSGRAESLYEELAHSLPCDLLVFKDRGFDPSKVLLPTTGGPHTDLAADLAQIFQMEFGSEVTLLHVADDPDGGKSFLSSWAAEHNLVDANQRVEVWDIESAIKVVAREHTMIIIGATQTGVLARLARGSLTLDVLHDVECSVLITERQTERSFFDRIFSRS